MKIDNITLIVEKEHAKVFIGINKKEYLVIEDCGETLNHWVNLKSINLKKIQAKIW